MRALLLSLLLLSAPVLAVEEAASPDPASLQLLIDQQRELKARLDAGDTVGLTPRQIREVRNAQDRFFSIIEGKKTLDELTIDQKIDVENALERINANVKNTRAAANDRNVCWRERVSGTTVKKTRCGTEAEMREAREGARDFLEKGKVCVPPGCGG